MATGLASTVEVLNSKLAILKGRDNSFAKDLIRSFKLRGSLSEKQAYWVDILVEKATGNYEAPQPKTECVGDFSKVMAMFSTAAKTLKYPKINLTVDGKPLTLALAGPNSKAPGTLNVTDGGRFGSNLWYGRIDSKGKWTQGNRPSPTEMDEVRSFLHKFSCAPEKIASEYGKLSGRCCFCNLKLTDEKSTAVGYGPVCASKWGLKMARDSAVNPLIQASLLDEPNDYYKASKGW